MSFLTTFRKLLHSFSGANPYFSLLKAAIIYTVCTYEAAVVLEVVFAVRYCGHNL